MPPRYREWYIQRTKSTRNNNNHNNNDDKEDDDKDDDTKEDHHPNNGEVVPTESSFLVRMIQQVLHVLESSTNTLVNTNHRTTTVSNPLSHQSHHLFNHQNNSNNDEFLVCSICFADMKPGDQFVVTRQCHHVFHAACMEAWLFSATPCKQQQHPRRGSRTNNTSTRNNHQCCPNCRAEILPFASTMTTTTTTTTTP